MTEILNNAGACIGCGLAYLLASILVLVGAMVLSRTEDEEISKWIIMDKGEK